MLQKRRVRKAEIYQAARLFELLPSAPNGRWQADVTYIHVPGHGWWYAVTVIDYFSRYLVPPEGGDPVTPAQVYVHRQPVGLPKWQGWAKAAREKSKAIIEDAHLPLAVESSEVAV